MKFSTAKYLGTVEVKDGGFVLNQAKAILQGKINDRLGAEKMVHEISQSIFNQDCLLDLAHLEGIHTENKKGSSDFMFSVDLILLKLQIYCILDKVDAKSVWKHILKPSSINTIKNTQSFFYHTSNGPSLLLTELVQRGLIPKEDVKRLSSVFPRSCIIDDYNHEISSLNPESATSSYMQFLECKISEAEENGNKREINRLQEQLAVIKDNIARYLS